MKRSMTRAQLRWWTVAISVGLLVVLGLPTSQASVQEFTNPNLLRRLSQPVQIRYWMSHPEAAPPQLAARLQQLHAAAGASPAPTPAPSLAPLASTGAARLFNEDYTGLPQNEESITVCRNDSRIVLGGTNDYRSFLDPDGNATGWHLSTDGGATLTTEGLLPPIRIAGKAVPSGGDPVVAADENCSLYAADLNYDPQDPFGKTNGIGLYKTRPARLRACGRGADPTCWPVRRPVAISEPHHFLDKPWMNVGRSGTAGIVVWVVYTDFNCPIADCQPPFTNQIKAVRCTADLQSCTSPILISGEQNSLQFGDVTIGSDGRVYITWEEDNDLANNFQPPEHMRFWLRVAEPGSTTFGPARLIANEPLNLGIADLHANDFRVATYPKSTVKIVDGKPRIYVVWESCMVRVLNDTVCEEPRVKLRYSNDMGVSWSPIRILSIGGDNYFATIADDPETSRLAVAWYTTRRDTEFHNRQDVELVTIEANGQPATRQIITQFPNDPEADPLLGGAFIGDYFEVFAHAGKAYVHFNANYRKVPLILFQGQGLPVPQQDNFLSVINY